MILCISHYLYCDGNKWIPRVAVVYALFVPGYACTVGTGYLSLEHQCSNPATYCPAGSQSPTLVSTGMHSVTTAQGFFFNQTTCVAGQYCQAGVAYPCPAGRYGNVTAETSELCSGDCTEGYLCLPGSTTPTAAPCYPNAGAFCPNVSSRSHGIVLTCCSLSSVRVMCRHGSFPRSR